MGLAAGAVPEAASSIFGSALPQAIEYSEFLATEGVIRGLVGPREAERVWTRHVLNSTVVAGVAGLSCDVADVGSGAGLPGVPLALVRPDLRITLIEPLLRRSTFLQEVVAMLELADRVQVMRARAEDVRERFDMVTARAVAPLDRLLGWTGPLRAHGGSIVAMKGSAAADEVRKSRAVLEAQGLVAEVREAVPYPGADPTSLVICR